MQTPALRATFHQDLVPNCGTVPIRMQNSHSDAPVRKFDKYGLGKMFNAESYVVLYLNLFIFCEPNGDINYRL